MILRFLGSRLFQFIMLSAFVFCLAVTNFFDVRYRDVIRFFSFDTLNRLEPRSPSDAVIIVDIDEETLKRLGQWPFPRNMLASMVKAMDNAEAKAIVFDMVFAENDRTSPHLMAEAIGQDANALPDYDEQFAKAIAEAETVVTGFTAAERYETRRPPHIARRILIKRSDKAPFATHVYAPKGVTTNIPVISQAASGNGAFIAIPEQDGINRSVPVIIGFGNGFYPSLAIEAIRVAYAPGGNLKVGQGIPMTISHDLPFLQVIANGMYHVKIGESDMVVPISKDGRLYTKFRNMSRETDYLSAYKLLDPSYSDEVQKRLKDKIVFVGTSAAGMKDIRSTPLNTYIPGVEIHANVVEQILQGDYLFFNEAISKEYESWIIFGLGLLVILLSYIASVLILTYMVGVLFFTIFGFAYYCYVSYGVLIDPLYPTFCLGLVFVSTVIWNYIRTESKAKEIRSAFGLYISPQFMQELTKDPEKLKLGGEMRELTVMFSDIRNFTTISESMTPEELIHTMNDFLTPMSDVVMAKRGTIDKYMGDAMMAFWNAPLDDDAHAAHAVEAALKMKEALIPVNKTLAERAKKEGKDPLRLAAGIGINTGVCAVGNMGSRQRFAYSALGDAVNLASRLEGQTKAYGLDLLIGEETAAQIKGFAFIEIDKIRVKGKAQAVRIYTVMGDKKCAKKAGFRRFRIAHKRFLNAYRRMQWDKAETLIKSLKGDGYGIELAAYYTMMQERIEDFKKQTPPHDWDGVYVAKNK